MADYSSCKDVVNKNASLPAICHQILSSILEQMPEGKHNVSIPGTGSQILGTTLVLEILKHLGLFVLVLVSLALLTLLLCHRPRTREVKINKLELSCAML